MGAVRRYRDEVIVPEFIHLLFFKITPLYFLIGLGYISGRYLQVEGRNIGNITLYLLSPLVVFNSVMQLEFSLGLLFLPIILFLMCVSICLAFRALAARLWQGEESGRRMAGILGASVGVANTGYFGIPVALALLPPEQFNTYVMLAFVPFVAFENTIAFYVTARGHYDARESLRKVLRLPALYGLLLASLLNSLGVGMPESASQFVNETIRGAYVTLGMMIIGIAISRLPHWRIHTGFLSLAFFAKFIVWPGITMLLVTLDRQFLHWYGADIHAIFIILSILPMAANSVTFATVLNCHPEEVATTVLISVLFALIYLPVMIWLLL